MLTPRVAALLLVSLSLTGCTLETTANPAASPAAAITGTAFGGQQPIASAKVYFLAVNTTGYGGRGITAASTNASLSLLNTGDGSDTIGKYVLTASSNGAFNLVGKYSCATGYNQSTGTSVSLPGNEQVYVYVLGGDAGAGANASSGLLAAVGPCNAPVATTLAVNEITTVAAAYALAGFATDATHISRSATALAATGAANAMLTAGNLVTVSTGLPTATTGTATRPVASLYSIADILAACVNTANGSPCTTLFAHTESAGDSGTAATDTATAAINLAHTPWPSDDGMNALFGLIPGTSPPYNGGLSAQPNDFTLGIQFSGGTLNEPTGIAIDAAGNVWLANQAAPTVTELSNLGVNVAGSPFSSHILGLNDAIDTLGNVWISGYNGSYIAKLSSAGASASGSPFTVGAQYASVTIDATNHVWSADEVSNLYVLNTSGTVTSTFTAGSLNGPQYVAFDSGGMPG